MLPLDAEEQRRAELIGRRLGSELAAALLALPVERRSIRAMAAHLKIDPSICQRAISAAQAADRPLEVLIAAPGVAGLRRLVQNLERGGVKPSLVRAADAAVQQFAEFIRDAAGSHARLQRRLSRTQDSSVPDNSARDDHSEEQMRRRMFQSTAAWFGARMDNQVTVFFERVAPDQTDHIEVSKLTACLGYRARASAVPLLAGNQYRSGEPKRQPGVPRPPGPTPTVGSPVLPPEAGVLLPAFSSTPTPSVTARINEQQSIHIIDPPTDSGGPIDAVVLQHLPRVRHPLYCQRPLLTCLVRITQPMANLVMDLWMERRLVAPSVPEVTVSMVDSPLLSGEGVPWYQRLPGTPTLELLNPDLLKPLPEWSQYAAATRHVFDLLRWPRSEFAGYRVRVPYPVWGSALVVTFKYPGDANDTTSV